MRRISGLAATATVALAACTDPGHIRSDGATGVETVEAGSSGFDGRPPDAVHTEAPVAEVYVIASADVVAARLARFLWAGIADADLTARLGGAPLTPARVSAVADQMLSDARSKNGISAFFRWWLLLESLVTLEKEDPGNVLDAALRESMTREAPALGAHLTIETRGTFADLLMAPFTFVDERLARHYGIPGVSGTEMRRMPYPGGQSRIGMLTGAGLLALFSSLSSPSWPAKRSWLITDPLLCSVPIRSFLPPPPLDPNRSIREQMIAVTKDGTCMGCHKLLNSPGFAFIGFDSFGRWRPEPGHGPNETAGWIPKEIMADEPKFEGPEQLARLLASRDEGPRCLTRHWMQYAVDPKTPAVGPAPEGMQQSLAEAYEAFARSGFELRQLVLAIVRTRAFAAAATQ
jgi:hypothetical protein